MKRNPPKVFNDGFPQSNQRQLVFKPYAHITTPQILEALKSLSHADLGSVMEASANLYAQTAPKRLALLPPDLWKLVFCQTVSPSFHSLSSASLLYESFALLWKLKTVCTSWKVLIEEALGDLKAKYSTSVPQFLRTIYFANAFGNLPIFEYLISNRHWDSGRKFCLELASCFGQTRMVNNLMEKHSLDPTFNSDYPLRLAVKTGHTEAVKLLLNDERVSPNVEHNYAIECASECGFADIVELLLQHPDVDPDDNDSLSIQVASNMGHSNVVALLLEDARVSPEADDNYAILRAVSQGHTEVVRLLLTHPNVGPDVHNNMPISIAAENGFTDIVELLLKDPRVTPDARGNDAVHRAVKHGRTDVVRLLMADERVNRHQSSIQLLKKAIKINNLEIVKLLTSLPFFDSDLREIALEESLACGSSHFQISEFLSELPHQTLTSSYWEDN